MKERDFQRWIVSVALMTGWHVWHVPAPMRMGRKGDWIGAREGAGLPDLILIHQDPPRIVFAEVKGTGGKLSPQQQEFLGLAAHVAEAAGQFGEGLRGRGHGDPIIGVHAFFPGMETAIENMLRSKNVA